MMAATLFNAAALTLFFEDANNMGLSNRTCLQLAHEGIVVPDDFKEFDKEGLSAIFSNLYKPLKVPWRAPLQLPRGDYARSRYLRCLPSPR
jgi:hypothetical protein